MSGAGVSGRLRQWGVAGWAALIEIAPLLTILSLWFHALQHHAPWPVYRRDPSIYAAVARLWAEGLMPYRDVYDFKPPLIYVVLRVTYVLWGYSAEAFRHALFAATALAALVVYAGLRRAGATVAAPLAALGFLTLVFANPWNVPLDNTETLVAACSALAFGLAAFHQNRPHWGWPIASGVAVALAALAKHPGALFALPAVVQIMLFAPAGPAWGARLRFAAGRVVLVAAGAVAVGALTIAYFAAHGAAGAMYEVLWVDAQGYAQLSPSAFMRWPWQNVVARTPPILRPTVMLREFSGMFPFAAGVLLLAGALFLDRSRWTVVAALWALAGYLVILTMPSGTDHYVGVLLFVGALPISIVCERVCAPLLGGATPQRGVLVGLVIAVLAFGSIWHAAYRRDWPVARIPVAPEAYEVIGARIASAAQPGDTLFVDDESYAIYAFSGVPPNNRIIYPNCPAPRAYEVWRDGLRRRPTFIFLREGTVKRCQQDVTPERLGADLFAIAQLVRESYAEWFVHPAGTVYCRTDVVRPLAP
jgi:4-amino-4-deoxy-L-arabinose transferase-like glycosyltransferase